MSKKTPENYYTYLTLLCAQLPNLCIFLIIIYIIIKLLTIFLLRTILTRVGDKNYLFSYCAYTVPRKVFISNKKGSNVFFSIQDFCVIFFFKLVLIISPLFFHCNLIMKLQLLIIFLLHFLLSQVLVITCIYFMLLIYSHLFPGAWHNRGPTENTPFL